MKVFLFPVLLFLNQYDQVPHTIYDMIKKFLARYTSNHYTDIYIIFVDTDILLKITDRVTQGFTQIK
jgi:hypothetical protein